MSTQHDSEFSEYVSRTITQPIPILNWSEAQSPEFGGFEPYVDESVVASFIGVEPRRVLELARAGELPAHPIGRTRKTWRFRLSEIEAHLSAHPHHRTVKMPVAVPRTKKRNRLG